MVHGVRSGSTFSPPQPVNRSAPGSIDRAKSRARRPVPLGLPTVSTQPDQATVPPTHGRPNASCPTRPNSPPGSGPRMRLNWNSGSQGTAVR